MKQIYALVSVFFFIAGHAQNINFPDAFLKSKLVNSDISNQVAKDLSGNYFAVDANADGEIEQSEALLVSELNLTNCDISDFEGILYFENLAALDCTGDGMSHGPISLDITGLSSLKKLICQDNSLTLGISSFNNLEYLDLDYCRDMNTLDFNGFENLKFLSCSETNIISLNLDGLTNLEYVDCGNFNQFTSVNLSSLISLKILICNNTAVTAIDVSGLSNLEELRLRNNQDLINLNLTGCTSLKILDCEDSQLASLTVNGLTQLEELYCNSNAITSLNINNCNNIKTIDCSRNLISNLNLNGLSNLRNLYCYHNQLTELDASMAINLIELYCDHNLMNFLDLSNLTNLKKLHCEFNQLPILNANYLSQIESLYCDHNEIVSLYIKNGINEQALIISNNPITYICADASQFSDLQPYIDAHPGCTLDSSCSLKVSEFTDTIAELVVSPNPAHSILNLNTKNRIDGIEIYNLWGQLVLNISNPQNGQSVDVSTLRAGNYFIRIITDTGNLIQKFIKD